jgi:hypothetical protein
MFFEILVLISSTFVVVVVVVVVVASTKTSQHSKHSHAEIGIKKVEVILRLL